MTPAGILSVYQPKRGKFFQCCEAGMSSVVCRLILMNRTKAFIADVSNSRSTAPLQVTLGIVRNKPGELAMTPKMARRFPTVQLAA